MCKKSARLCAIGALIILSSVAHAQAIVAPDTDGDGINDARDNCLLISNADQRDTNADGYGNACDMDLNDDGIVNIIDLGMLRAVFFTANEDADANGDGVVNVTDLGTMRSQFFGAPGPTRFLQFVGSFGQWSAAGNWRPARLPQPEDHVLFSSVGNATLSDAVSVHSMELKSAFLEGLGGSLDVATQLLISAGPIDSELQDLPVTVGESVDVLGRVATFGTDLAISDPNAAVLVGSDGRLWVTDGSIDFPGGVASQGTTLLDGPSGTLGPLSGGDFTVTIVNSTLRLVGTHDGRALGPNNIGNFFTLAGDIIAAVGSTPQLFLNDDSWAIEGASTIIGPQIIFGDFTLAAPAELTLASTFLEGTMHVAADASLELQGTNQLSSIDIVLDSPVTTSQAAPQLFLSNDPLLEGFGSIVVPPAALPGTALTHIEIDGDGDAVAVDSNIALLAQRSVQIDLIGNTQLTWSGNWQVDGSMSPPEEIPELSVSGRWEVLSGINAINASLLLDGDWLVAGGITATSADVALDGEWSGAIALTDGSITLDVTEAGPLSNLSLINSVANVRGLMGSNTFSGTTADADSRVSFSGEFGSSFTTNTLDTDNLPQFIIEDGAAMQNIVVVGSVPLQVRGGVLNFMTLEVDAIVLNGADVTFGSVFLDESNLILEAADLPTRLNLVSFQGQSSLRGDGEIQFAGAAAADDLNILSLESLTASPTQSLGFRTVSAGGRIEIDPSNFFSFYGLDLDVLLDAPFHDVVIDADVNDFGFGGDVSVGRDANLILTGPSDVLIEGDLHLGSDASLSTDADSEVGFFWDLVNPRVFSVELAGPDRFGRLITPNFPQLFLDGMEFAPALIDNYTPADCTSFTVIDNASINGTLFGFDTSGLQGFDATLIDDGFRFGLTVFQMPGCPPPL